MIISFIDVTALQYVREWLQTVTLYVQNESLRAEVDTSRLKLQLSTDEIITLRKSLEESRASGDRLRQESETVVDNVNQWVREKQYVIFLVLRLYLLFIIIYIYVNRS